MRLGLALCGLAMLQPSEVRAQGYRLRLDSRVQRVAYRGVTPDSVSRTDVVTAPTGGFQSPDGFAVRCPPGSDHCFFFRPGEPLRGGPLVTSADLAVWGVGIRGLSFRANGRLGFDLGDSEVWPGTEPELQLVEAYADFAHRLVRARGGRQLLVNRLGIVGFDGVRASGGVADIGLQLDAYAGLGLARASALPVTSPALDPLDEFQPRKRGLLVGGAVGYRREGLDLRLDYQREVGREPSVLFAERVALSGYFRLLPRWSVTAGADYDLANTWIGNADATVRFTSRLLSAQAGVRQYRPHFDLWTVWGAFSPVPYQAVNAAAWLAPVRGVQLRARWEGFEFSDAEATTPLVGADDNGWRLGFGVAYAPREGLIIDAGYHEESAPGASSSGFDGSVSWLALPSLSLSAYGSTLERPLEFRFNEAEVVVVGLDAEWRPSERLRVGIGGAQYHEDRERPDAAALDWNQTRLHGRVSLLLGSSADRSPLPPALRTRPPAGVSR